MDFRTGITKCLQYERSRRATQIENLFIQIASTAKQPGHLPRKRERTPAATDGTLLHHDTVIHHPVGGIFVQAERPGGRVGLWRCMRSILFILLTLLHPELHAEQPLPEGGISLLAPGFILSGGAGKGGMVGKVKITGQVFEEAMRISVATASPEQPWSAQLATPLGGEIRKDDRILVRYLARRIGEGKGHVVAKLQHGKPDYSMIGMTETAKFGTEWEQINQAFIAKLPAATGQGEVTLFFGDQVQTVEIAGLEILNYGPTFDLAKLPRQKVTYDGREADAAWRKSAFERIESLRKEDYAIQVTGPDGRPLANTSVVVELDRHQFGFGSCVTRGWLSKEGPDADRYREVVQRTFSRVVFENDLKPDSFPHEARGREELEKSFAWLKDKGISIRGHYLMQEAVDGWSRARLSDPVKYKTQLMDSIRERVSFAGSRVVEWDVINHPIAWQGAEMLSSKDPSLGNVGLEAFELARSLTNLPLCINEDQLFRPGAQQDKTFELLQSLKVRGIRVDGLGNQAHIHCSYLPTPEDILRITDRFASVVPKQVITEYDLVSNGDEQLAADYLRDCLIACFSHPAYDGFLLWGFWEKSHWIPEAALWKSDWTRTAAAGAWEEWIGNRWHTRVTLVTDAAGEVRWRGFKGTYHLEVGGKRGTAFQPGRSAISVKAP